MRSEFEALIEDIRSVVRVLVTDLTANKEERNFQIMTSYQRWYSAALPLVDVLAPDRLDEFQRMYRSADPSEFGIGDWAAGRIKVRGDTNDVVLLRVMNQKNIFESIAPRMTSQLSNIRGTLQADLFDSELDAGQHLLENGHVRAAGVVAGVVLEAHLQSVCMSHKISIGRKKKTIGNLKDALRDASVVDLPVARQIEAIADIRNLCTHKGGREPTTEEVQRLIEQTSRYTKELY